MRGLIGTEVAASLYASVGAIRSKTFLPTWGEDHRPDIASTVTQTTMATMNQRIVDGRRQNSRQTIDATRGSPEGNRAMPCDSKLLNGQSLSERMTEVRAAIARLSELLVSGRVKPVVGPQGAIAFSGWSETDRSRVTDACAFRAIMVSGSSLAKAALARAEQMAGRSVDRRVVGHGVHSHDSGVSWHDHKG